MSEFDGIMLQLDKTRFNPKYLSIMHDFSKNFRRSDRLKTGWQTPG